MNPAPEPRFEVSMSRATRESIVGLHSEARRQGQGAAFRESLRTIMLRLRTDPVTFGEELFDLRALRLTVKVAAILPISVEFGVYRDRPVVFVRSIRYVPPG